MLTVLTEVDLNHHSVTNKLTNGTGKMSLTCGNPN
jgi:hypothetical protein